MMNLVNAEKELAEKLRSVHSEAEAASMSDWVMEYITGSKRTERIAKKTGLNEGQLQQLKEVSKRLLQQEPIQYVLNQSWFCGFKFYVDHRVLIPRPETEELVEWIISNCKFPVDELSILDVGTGSGCIPVSLKRRIRKADVWSCDKSADALEVARKNADTLGTPINFIGLDFLDRSEWEKLPVVDILVSNPPYIPGKEERTLAPNVRNFEPHMALFVPDDDPLIFYKALAEFGKIKLKKGGTIYAEIHEGLAAEVLKLFNDSGYHCELKKDMQGKERMIKLGLVGQ